MQIFGKQISLGITGLFGRRSDMLSTPTESKGAPGFANYNGFIEEKEKNPALLGRQKYRTYSNTLANVAIVGACVRYFLNLIAKAKWSVNPADESTAAKEAADFVDDVMNDMRTSWSRIIRRQAMYRFYGFVTQEWTAKTRDDGQIGLLDIMSRPQHTIERWDTNREGSVLGIVQRSPQGQDEIYLPREKIVYSVDDSLTDSPDGLGIFRHVVDTADRLTRFEQLEAFGFETDLRGMPVGRAPLVELAKSVQRGDLTQKQADAILKPLRQFVTNHIKNPKLAMMLDSAVYTDQGSESRPSNNPQWDIQLLKGSNTTQEEVAEAIGRLNHEIARLIGTEHLLLGSDGRGTQALSRDKSHNFFLIIDSTLSELEETFNKDIIDVLWELNGFPDDTKPTFSTEAVQFRDIEQITGAIKDLADAGDPLMPDDPVINEVRELLGLSQKDMDQVLLDLGLNNGRQASSPDGRTTEDDDVRNMREEEDDE